MNKEFIPYEQALELKELGFDIRPNFGGNTSLYSKNGYHTFYTNYGVMGSGLSDGYIYAPTFSQAFRWFRQKWGMRPEITSTYGEWDFYIARSEWNDIPIREGGDMWTYEDAETKCIDRLIKLITDESKRKSEGDI